MSNLSVCDPARLSWDGKYDPFEALSLSLDTAVLYSNGMTADLFSEWRRREGEDPWIAAYIDLVKR